MFTSSNVTSMHTFISSFSIEYRGGYYHVLELNTPVSKHETLTEAQWIKSVLESESKVA